MASIGEGPRPDECRPGGAPDTEQLSWDIFDGGSFSDDGARTRTRCEAIAEYLLKWYDIKRKGSNW